MVNWKFWKQEGVVDKEKDRISDVTLARKEASEENFARDVENLGKEIIVTLNENIPKIMKFVPSKIDPAGYSFLSDYSFKFGRTFDLFGGKHAFPIAIFPATGDNKRWGEKRHIYFAFEATGMNIPISRTDKYTQKQLEKAKKQILAEILNQIQYEVKNGQL